MARQSLGLQNTGRDRTRTHAHPTPVSIVGGCLGEVTGGQVGGDDGAVGAEVAGPGAPCQGGGAGVTEVKDVPAPSLQLTVGMVAPTDTAWWRQGQLRISV